ncbi:hypothetical protein D3C84_831240 [compost metagenome]
MQQTGQCHVISGTDVAILIEQKFGYEKQRDALGSGGRVLNPSQDHVHDIVGQFVVSTGDKHLLAEHTITAICGKLRSGAQVAEGGTLAGFSQGHGAAETAGEHRREETLLQRSTGEALHQIAGPDGEKRIAGRCSVGSIEIGHAATQYDLGQLKTAVFVVVVGDEEPCCGEGVPGKLSLWY